MKTLQIIENGRVLHEWPIADTDVLHMEETSITRAAHITAEKNICSFPGCKRPRNDGGMSRRCLSHRYDILDFSESRK